MVTMVVNGTLICVPGNWIGYGVTLIADGTALPCSVTSPVDIWPITPADSLAERPPATVGWKTRSTVKVDIDATVSGSIGALVMMKSPALVPPTVSAVTVCCAIELLVYVMVTLFDTAPTAVSGNAAGFGMPFIGLKPFATNS